MSKETDLRNALNASLDVVEQAISSGAQLWDRMSPSPRRDSLWNELSRLMEQREAIQKLMLRLDFASPEVQQALAALNDIAKENEDVAGHMKTATDWLNSAAALLGQATKVVAALDKIKKAA